jgi:hypothetical protein
MSNHEHLVVTDTQGRLPDFLRDFHRVVALGVQAIRGWQGEVWDGAATSCVTLCTPSAIVEKLAYIMNNPVRAGLVHAAEDWPGVMVLPTELGRKTWKQERPNVFYSAANPQWPGHAELQVTMPKHYLSDDELRRAVSTELAMLTEEVHRKLRAQGRRVLGRAGIMKIPPSHSTHRTEPKRARQPTIAAGRGQKAMLTTALAALKRFRRKYRDALSQWREGIRDVLFPRYTWLMSCLHGVPIEPEPI